MIRKLLGLIALLVAGLLVYNYFFGTAEEKANSREIFSQIKELGQSAWDLLRSEKEKLEAGKYDGALDNIQALFDRLRSQAEKAGDSEALQKLSELESRSEELRGEMQAEEAGRDRSESSTGPSRALQEDWKQLLEETEQLVRRLER